VVGIPVGFMIGASVLSRMFNPADQPDAPGVTANMAADWPAGFQGCQPAAIWTIFYLLNLPMIISLPRSACRAAGLHERGPRC
jgi:hypothetical protein